MNKWNFATLFLIGNFIICILLPLDGPPDHPDFSVPFFLQPSISFAETSNDIVEPTVEEATKDWKDLNWHSDLQSATQVALDKRLPILIDFSTSWCGWCRKLEADTYSDPKVWEKLDAEVVLCQIDGDQERELTRQFRVRGYPTLVVTDSRGNEILRVGGYVPPETFLNTTLSFLSCIDKVVRYEKAVLDGKVDVEANLKQEFENALPENADFLNETAWNWLTAQKDYFHSALVLSQKALNLDPENRSILDTVAKAQMLTGNLDGAVAGYRALAQVDFPNSKINLACTLAMRSTGEDGKEAVRLLRECVEEGWIP